MRLGVRWNSGTPPHSSVPELLLEAVEAQEKLFPLGQAWTLTWLEGRAHCQLDDLVRVEERASGTVTVTELMTSHDSVDDDDDDDWLV